MAYVGNEGIGLATFRPAARRLLVSLLGRMSHDASYHRSFLPDGPFEADCRQGCHGNGKKLGNPPSFAEELSRSPPGDPLADIFRKAELRDRAKPYFRSQRRRAAYMTTGSDLKPVHIVEKIDQNFAEVATPWEREFSELVGGNVARFTPVVDQSYSVVGHVGSIKGYSLIVVKDSPHDQGNYHGPLDEYLDKEEPVFVSSKRPEGWTTFDRLQPANIYTVVTGIDGEVMSGAITGSAPGAIAVDGPMDYITGAAALLKLGAAAARGIVKSIVRKAIASNAVKELRGPTRKILERVLARRSAAKAAKLARNAYNPATGMTRSHHRAFVDAAEESQLIIVVRHTNPKSIPLIEKGCPGKPKNLEFINTSPHSGIVMANVPQEVLQAQRLGYFVVVEGKKAQRLVVKNGKEVAEDMHLDQTFWQIEKGQVIDPRLKKPIVGDYDLTGVIDPRAPGRNLGLVAKNGEAVTDVTNPLVQRASQAINLRLDMPRVLHGPQDMYKDFRKGASAYMPDGTVRHFETEDGVRAFYESLKRQPRAGQYPQPAEGVPVVDELAARRRW